MQVDPFNIFDLKQSDLELIVDAQRRIFAECERRGLPINPRAERGLLLLEMFVTGELQIVKGGRP